MSFDILVMIAGGFAAIGGILCTIGAWRASFIPLWWKIVCTVGMAFCIGSMIVLAIVK